MNHIQMYKEVQENPNQYTYEIRSLMKEINGMTDFESIRNDLLMLVEFIDQKISDTQVLMQLPCSNNIKLIGSSL